MSLSDSQTQSGERSRETSEVFESVFGFLMDFADRAETTGPQPKHRAVVDDDTTNEVHDDDDDEEEPSEDEGGGNAGELLDKLPVGDKEALLKDVLSEIVGNMLDKLPEDEKEAFLVRCFCGLFTKLPRESREVIRIKVKDASYESPLPSPIPTTIPIPQKRIRLSSFARVQMDDFDPRFQSPSPSPSRFSVNHPDTVGNPRPPHPGPPPQQPLPGPQQPPPPPGPQQPTPGLTARRR